jgi:hypothetical protein
MRRRHIGQTAAVHSESGLRQTSLVLFSLLLAPNRCRDQPQKRPVVQLHGITLSFHREMADASRKLVGPDVTAAVSEIAPEPTGHGLPLSKCEAYNRVYEQPCGSS